MAAPHVPDDFGGMLRQARERRGLSLRQISNSTKIAMMTLEALERNDIRRLPGGIFSRSFVRAYAVEVGLDPEVVIGEFMGQFPHDSVTAGHPTTSQIEDHEAVESDRRTASTFLRLVAISIPIAAVVTYFGTSGRRTPGSRQTEGAGPPSAVGMQQSAVDRPQLAAADRQPAVANPPANAVPGTPAAVATTPAGSPGRLLVQVSATRRAWISAIVDGARAVQRELQPGEDAAFEVQKEIVLTAGDAGAVAVTFNGLPARPLGGNGRVVTLRVDPTNFKSYLAVP